MNVSFELRFTSQAETDKRDLERRDPAKHRKVLKTLGLLQSNPRHPGLHTHKYDRFTGPNGEDVFAAYVENRTPAAYRLFFCYGPERRQITVLAITQHP